jgi:hypothetical protein
MLLSVANNLIDSPYVVNTYTDSTLGAGDGTIPVKNINSFQNQYAIQIGNTGEAEAEVKVLGGVPSGNNLVVSGTLRFDHAIDVPVYQIHYDKVIFKRSTAGTAGTASALATVSMTPNLYATEYNDSSGAATYAYKTQWYNSVSGDVSAESDWFVPGGPSWYSLQKLRSRGTTALYNANYLPKGGAVDDWINEWVELMTNAALKVNQAYSMGTTQYSFGTAGLGTVTEPLFKYAAKIELTSDGVTWTRSNEIPLNRFGDSSIYAATNPRHYWQGDSVFGVLPFGNAGTARMSLGKLHTVLVDDGDELPQFLKGYTTSCIEYLLYRAYDLDQKTESADRHYARMDKGKMEFIAEITPRDYTGIKLIDMVDGGTGREDDMYADTMY